MNELAKLAESGILGLLLSLAIATIVILARELRANYKERIADTIESRNKVMEPLKEIQDTLSRIVEEEAINRKFRQEHYGNNSTHPQDTQN